MPLPPLASMRDDRTHCLRYFSTGRKLRQRMTEYLRRPGVAELLQEQRSLKKRGEVERGDRETAFDCGQGRADVAAGAPHRRQLHPEVGACRVGARSLL